MSLSIGHVETILCIRNGGDNFKHEEQWAKQDKIVFESKRAALCFAAK